MSKKFLVSLVGTITVFIFLMTWLYPYSSFSLYKKISYDPDSIVVDQYVQDLKEYKDSFQEQLSEMDYSDTENFDITLDQTQYIFPFFEQDWLIHKNSTSIGEKELEHFLFEIKGCRDMLMDLFVKVDYSSETRQYLGMTMEYLLGLEESIHNIKDMKFNSRSDIDRTLGNLQGSFRTTLDAYMTFYRSAQSE